MDNYKKFLEYDQVKMDEYYRKSLIKTEQQKLLEHLLSVHEIKNVGSVADVGCGAGTMSYHINHSPDFLGTEFNLIDYSEHAIQLAKELNTEPNMKFYVADAHKMPFLDNTFDLTLCFGLFSIIENPEQVMNELIRVTTEGGRIFISSLFNFDHEVDIYAQLLDHTRESGKHGIKLNYNTYCAKTVLSWINKPVTHTSFVPFHPKIDFKQKGMGIGTYTIKSPEKRLQISGGYLMNWGIFIIEK